MTFTWSKSCVLIDMTTRDAEEDNPAIIAPTGVTFTITNAKLYVLVVTLSAEDDLKIKMIQHLLVNIITYC